MAHKTIEGQGGSGRRTSADRISQIVCAAEDLILETDTLPLSIPRIGEMIEASRALVYAYFPTQEALVEAVLAKNVLQLEQALHTVDWEQGIETVAVACADTYLRHVAERGPLLHIAFRDKANAGRLSRAASYGRDRIYRRLSRAARRELRLTPREALALVQLILAIPDEVGRLVWRGEIALEDALETSNRLVISGLRAMTPTGEPASAG